MFDIGSSVSRNCKTGKMTTYYCIQSLFCNWQKLCKITEKGLLKGLSAKILNNFALTNVYTNTIIALLRKVNQIIILTVYRSEETFKRSAFEKVSALLLVYTAFLFCGSTSPW